MQIITRSIDFLKSLVTKIKGQIEPSNFKEASKHSSYMDAMKLQYEALMKNRTWDLFPYSTLRNVIGNKWVYKVKFNLEGEIYKYKERLVAKLFS